MKRTPVTDAMDDGFDKWLNERHLESADVEGRIVPGTTVGVYVIESFLGKGGFAEVYKARAQPGEQVAMKFLSRLDDGSRARFEREGRILAQVHHRNLPVFLGFGISGNRPYMVTELLHPLELPSRDREVAKFMKSVMSAVEALHHGGFVHRDIKPTNILCRASGEPVLIDFGLTERIAGIRNDRSPHSAEMDKNMAAGTVGFSAPEQFTGTTSGPASDVHALGALIGACFGDSMPGSWRRIYLTATNSNPAVRYQSVDALRHAVGRRYMRKILLTALSVMIVGIGVYVAVRAVHDHSVENRAPHRFQETG